MVERLRKEGLAKKLNLPTEFMTGLPRVELVGDQELLLERYRGVLSCEKDEIHVDAGKWVLRIRGRELVIRIMREYELRITGQVDSLELM